MQNNPESEDGLAAGENGKDAVVRSIRGLNAVMRARQRLASNTNNFLAFSVLFLNLKGLLTGRA